MKDLNILFTGVGRRVELIQAFRNAAIQLNIHLKLYGCDISENAPALIYCDYKRIVCRMDEEDYIHQLVDICIKDKIDLVVPTIDTDLLILSQNVDTFQKNGTKVLISHFDKIKICRDKNKISSFFEMCGLKTPKTFHDVKKYNQGFPCFIKPQDGSGSINAYKVNNKKELLMYADHIDDYIVQPYIEGREYTIDVFCDFEGKPIYITPRERIQIRAGEVLQTRICMDSIMIEECKKIIELFKPKGAITVQLIKSKKDGVNYYIEINPRYGGGAPLSIKSGANSPKALLELLLGKDVSYSNNVCQNAIYSRFDQSVCTYNGDDNQPINGVIFDLDDTLYSEKEYVRSGYKKIAETLGEKDTFERLWNNFLDGKQAIDSYLSEICMTDRKEECLEVYRNQIPDISLYDGMRDLILDLKEKGIKVGIITDGRPIGQHSKIKALGLDTIIDDIIITDELGGIQFRKPNDISFRIMQNRWKIPFEQIVYIGDNQNKDFQAPNQLGMKSFQYINNDGLYSIGYKKDTTIEELREFLLC